MAKKITRKNRGSGIQCFHCLSYSVHWDADFDFSDYGYEGEGVVHVCHCGNCGAEIEYRVRMDDTEEDQNG